MNKRFLFLCWLMVSITISADEYVDLGLPSGTLWATCNIGASAPEGFGGDQE